MKRVVIYETIVPDYRLKLFEDLKGRYGDAITLACGEVSFSPTLRTCAGAAKICEPLRNSFWLDRQLLWQSGLFSMALRADLVIAEYSVRAPSTWLLLSKRKLVNKPTILWGHASGRRRVSNVIRRWMLNRCDGFIAYMPGEKRRLQEEFQNLRVWVAPNAMMREAECFGIYRNPEEIVDMIYVGRLVETKKVGLLVEGFARAVREGWVPRDSRLLLVGDGPEATGLRTVVKHAALNKRVLFAGHVSDVGILRRLYSTSLVSVSPGGVGLAATQSLSFGVPIVVADNEVHGPEVEICRDGHNALFFRANAAEALACTLRLVFERREFWVARRQSISDEVRRDYTFERMMETFAAVISANSG